MSATKSNKEALPASSEPPTKSFIDLSEIDDRVYQKVRRIWDENPGLSQREMLKKIFEQPN